MSSPSRLPSREAGQFEDVSDLLAKDLAQSLLEKDQQREAEERQREAEEKRKAKIRKAVEYCRAANYNKPELHQRELVDLNYINKSPEEIIENTLQELASLNDLLTHALDKTLGLNESTTSLNLVDSTASGQKRKSPEDPAHNASPPNPAPSTDHEFKVPKAPKRLKVKPSASKSRSISPNANEPPVSTEDSCESSSSSCQSLDDQSDESKKHKKKKKKEESYGHRCRKHLKKKEELVAELEKVDAELKRISSRTQSSKRCEKQDALQAELKALDDELKRISSKTPSLTSKHREKDLVETIERLEAELKRISTGAGKESGTAKEPVRTGDDGFYGRTAHAGEDGIVDPYEKYPDDKFGSFRKPQSADYYDKRAYHERINPSHRHYLDEEYDYENGRSRKYESSSKHSGSKHKYYEDDRDYDRDYDRSYSSGRDKYPDRYSDKYDKYDLKDPFYMRKLKHENSISNWTKFCSRIAKGSKQRADESDNSSIESGDFYSDDDDKHSIISERFIARDALKAKEIKFDVRDFKSRQARSATEIKADLADQFPVSSGLKHQWKEVEKPATGEATDATKKEAEKSKKGAGKPVSAKDKDVEDKVNDFLNKHAQPSNKSGIDIGSIMSQRLAALKVLAQDKTNRVALNQLRQADDQIGEWSKSNGEPEEEERSAENTMEPESGLENFVSYKDFTKTAKSKDGVGMALLQKMGWQPGQGECLAVCYLLNAELFLMIIIIMILIRKTLSLFYSL